MLRHIDENVLDEFYIDIRSKCVGFDSFIESLPTYDEASVRVRLDAELTFFKLLNKLPSLNRNDVSRAGGIFTSLYSIMTPEEAA